MNFYIFTSLFVDGGGAYPCDEPVLAQLQPMPCLEARHRSTLAGHDYQFTICCTWTTRRKAITVQCCTQHMKYSTKVAIRNTIEPIVKEALVSCRDSYCCFFCEIKNLEPSSVETKFQRKGPRKYMGQGVQFSVVSTQARTPTV